MIVIHSMLYARTVFQVTNKVILLDTPDGIFTQGIKTFKGFYYKNSNLCRFNN